MIEYNNKETTAKRLEKALEQFQTYEKADQYLIRNI